MAPYQKTTETNLKKKFVRKFQNENYFLHAQSTHSQKKPEDGLENIFKEIFAFSANVKRVNVLGW